MGGKIFKLWYILFLVLLWCVVGWAGEERPRYYGDEKSMDWLNKNIAKEFEPMGAHVTGVFKSPFEKLGPTSSPYYDTTGVTYYDYGANARLQRQINRSTLGYIHTCYTKSYDGTQVPRNVFYAAWLNTGVQSAGEIQVSDIFEEGRGGFSSVTSLPDGRAVVIYHKSYSQVTALNYPPRGTYIALEAAPGSGNFNSNEFQAPDSVPVGGDPNKFRDSGIWPVGDAQKYKDTNFVHVVFIESNYATVIPTRYFGWSRAKETFPNFMGGWTFPVIVDTLRDGITPIVVTSRQSAKVAIVWTHPRKGYPPNPSNPDSLGTDVDLYMVESKTGGDDWINGFNNNANDHFQNITNYTDGDPHRASLGDMSAAYDANDSLVIAFSAPIFIPKSGASATQGSIYFWRRGIGGGGSDLREVYNYSIADADLRRIQQNVPVMNPHVGVYQGAHPDSIGDYYIIWTMGAGNDTTENSTTGGPLQGYWNNDIYCTATTNNGFSWSAITNLTNSHTPACAVGACDNDWFASLAVDIDDTLRINYINDKVPIPGGGTRSTDTTRLTPVFYYKVHVKGVEKDTLASVTPSNLTGFDFQAGSPNDTFVFFSNGGNQNLTVNSIVADNVNASVTVTPYGAPPFVIPEGGAPAKVFLNFDGTSEPCSSYTVTWTFNTNASNSNADPPSAGVFKVKAQFALASGANPFFQARSLNGLNRPIQTAKGWRVNLSNAGTVGGGIASKTGMFVIQADTGAHFLSQGTVYMGAILSNGDTMLARNIYEESEFRPLYIEGALNETILVKDTTFLDSVTFAQALQQGRPAKAGTWKVARVAYALDLFNDLKNFPDLTPEAYPWPGVWMGYWFKDQFWFKNNANYHWLVWYRQKIKKAPPCWWPNWPGSPTIASNIYDGVACDWDPFSDSLDLSTGVNLPINSSGYNDTMKYAWARGRGTPFDKRYAAQVFLCDTTVHLRGDTVCVGNNCTVNACSLSAADPYKRIFGTHPLSYEGFAAQTGGYETHQIWPWATRKGAYSDSLNFKQNKQDVTILTTHACFGNNVDTFNYALGLSVSVLGLDTLKKGINEMRFAMALDTIKAQPCTYKPGDVNGDNNWTLPDIIGLVNMVFKSAPKPTPLCRTDCNASGGNPSLTDIIYLVNKVFKSGPNPIIVGECCKL